MVVHQWPLIWMKSINKSFTRKHIHTHKRGMGGGEEERGAMRVCVRAVPPLPADQASSSAPLQRMTDPDYTAAFEMTWNEIKVVPH